MTTYIITDGKGKYWTGRRWTNKRNQARKFETARHAQIYAGCTFPEGVVRIEAK